MCTFSSLFAASLLLAAASAAAMTCDLNSVCFAIDMSGSIDNVREYKAEIDAVTKIANTIGESSAVTSYSAFGFASSSVLVSKPTTDLNNFVSTVQSFTRISGGTNISSGLSSCFKEIGSSTGTRVIVLLTDGDDGGNARTIATTIKNAGVDIVTVGIGAQIKEPYLKALATSPEFFVRTIFRRIIADTRLIAEKICAVPKDDSPSVACERAYKQCDFAIDGADSVPVVALGMQDRALTSKIVSRRPNERVGIVNANGGAADFIMDDGSARPITDFGRQRFSSSTFKTYNIRNSLTFSGVGHQTLQSDQAQVAAGKCVRMFVTNYQLLEPAADGYVMGNVNIRKTPKKCVVFYVKKTTQ